MWASHGKYCPSRLEDTLSAARSHWKPAHPPEARVAAVECALAAVGAGLWLFRRAGSRERLLPEEVALGAAWVFVVGGLVWLEAYLTGSTLLGFGEPWTQAEFVVG